MDGNLKTSPGRLRYVEIRDHLESLIRSGHYPPESRLPSFRQLADDLGVNALTVRRSIQSLASKGLVEMRPRVGCFVKQNDAIEAAQTPVQIGLACHRYLIETSRNHPLLGAYVEGVHRVCTWPEHSVASMFYGDDRFIDDIGEEIVTRKLRGLIAPDGGLSAQDLAFLTQHNVIVADSSPTAASSPGVLHFDIDRIAGLRSIVDHLRRFGHQNIAFVSYKNGAHPIANDVVKLILDYRLGDPRKQLIRVRNDRNDLHYDDVLQLLDLDPLPTAAFVWDELLADVLMRGCEARNIRVPTDLSIVSFYDMLPHGHRVPLTSLIRPEDVSQLLSSVAQSLATCIADSDDKPEPLMHEPKLVAKASTSIAPGFRFPTQDKS